jgi:hypothetical protein|nr:MAG TPA: Baseplate structural protein [Bacteriophage sp.]
MARTIQKIEESITGKLRTSFSLSTSAASEWRSWVHCVAYAIHMFELALDTFKAETEVLAARSVAGTLSWYNERCHEFQLGYDLTFDTDTGRLGYDVMDESARIIKVASVIPSEDGTVVFRVATQDEEGNIVPLSDTQLRNFTDYIEAIKFAGIRTSVISTYADTLRYELTVYYSPSSTLDFVRRSVSEALDGFRASRRFGGTVYRHKMIEAVTETPGVVTAELRALSSKSHWEDSYRDIGAYADLYAGYFNYAGDCEIDFVPLNDTRE